MNSRKYDIYQFPECNNVVVSGDIHGDFNLLVNKICVQYQMQNTLVIVAGDCGFGFERAGGAAVVIEHNLVADLRYICLFLFIDILLLNKLCLLMEGPRCPQHQVEYMRASLLSQSKREAKE